MAEGGTDWGSMIPAFIGLVQTGVGAGAASTTDCGKQCRAECKGCCGTFAFGQKKECKSTCKKKCIAKANEPLRTAPNPILTTVIVVVIILAIVGIIWWIVKKK